MPRLVLKFGGTSVRDIERIKAVAEIIDQNATSGTEVAVVVSAMGHTTDELISLAHKITPTPSDREMDMLLSTGEQVSIALLTMALQARGRQARSLTGAQAGIITDGKYGDASITAISTGQIESLLTDGNIVIVAGYQGIAPHTRELTTLGRGGSDTTAVALAAFLQADFCDIYTDVNGVYSADPRTCKNARRLTEISYDDMLEMAVNGAQVLNARSMELAKRGAVTVRLRSTFEPADPGTLVTGKDRAASYRICGVACDTSHGLFRLKILARKQASKNIYIHHLQTLLNTILQPIAIDSIELREICSPDPALLEYTFVAPGKAYPHLVSFLQNEHELGSDLQLSLAENVARISLIGKDLLKEERFRQNFQSTFEQAEIPVQSMSLSEIRFTAVVPDNFKDMAVSRVHETFVNPNLNQAAVIN